MNDKQSGSPITPPAGVGRSRRRNYSNNGINSHGESSLDVPSRRVDAPSSSSQHQGSTSSDTLPNQPSPTYAAGEPVHTSSTYTGNSYLVRSPMYSASSAHHQQAQNFSNQSPPANSAISATPYSPFPPQYSSFSTHTNNISPTYVPRSQRQGYTSPYMPSSPNYPVPMSSLYSPSSPTYTTLNYFNIPSSTGFHPSNHSTSSYVNVTSPTHDNTHTPSSPPSPSSSTSSPSFYNFSALNSAYANGVSVNPIRAGQIAIQGPPPNTLTTARQLRNSHHRNTRNSVGDSSMLVMRYCKQLTTGCLRRNCVNPYCASNSNFTRLDNHEAMVLAHKLAAQGESHICNNAMDDNSNGSTMCKRLNDADISSHDTLNYAILETLYNDCKERGDYNDLYRNVYNVFSNHSKLANSFKQMDPYYREQCPLNIEETRKSYNLIIKECPDNKGSKTLVTATIELLERIKSSYETLQIETLACFIIILQNPLLMDHAEHADIMPLLVEIIAGLPESRKKILCQYFLAERPNKSKSYNENKTDSIKGNDDDAKATLREDFRYYVILFQQFITLRLWTRATTPNKDKAVMNATRCLSMFYKLNEERRLLHFSEFYNDAVNETIDIKDDFPHFKQKDGFSFCDHPFILTPIIKADVLKIESMVQMRHELQDSFFRAMFIGVNSPYLILEIRRDHIIRDALYQLESKSPQDLKKQLRVQFAGEDGVDEGGVQKEFFQLVVREMFDQKYGMFTQNEESRLCWFNQNPFDESALDEYKLIGRLLGLAIYNSVILDVHFPVVLYRKLKGQPATLTDLKELDPSLGKGLEQLLELEDDVESTYNRTFQIEYESFGHRITHELKPGGAHIKLTNENRQEFVDLFVDFWLNKSIKRQFNAFKEGFDLVCGGSAIQLFRPEEVEQLMCGSRDLDFEALENVTQYDGGFNKNSQVVRNFWEIVHGFTEEQKKRLLFFTTGSDRVPIGGLSKLQFVIAKNGGDSDRLPTSHTCYNVLLLCEYSSKEKLKERLLTAISNAEGFGMI
ncbi:5254_t:CDS:10 [Paraglomus occultum]|uniref:HECT-type E3 ubiquitin transferase n=1 Tax=Paraglomus occultum TaxID=144539 RepID=A0A9N8VGT3_9GLOM|nr:5254_t:CDS:10 [Paraglomus occultum]